jgi:hypothetical protein
MLKQPPAPGIPGMSDTLEFVKNLWGSMNVPGVSIPGMAAPAMTTEELDKKIADLKAVEAWLNLNGTMLRGTIQTLEVQRGTIAALQSMGASFAQAMKPPGAGDKEAPAAPFGPFFAQAGTTGQAAGGQQAGDQGQPGKAPMPAAVAWWNVLEEQFRQAVSSAMSPESMAGAAAMAKDAASRFAAAGQAAPAAPAAPTDATAEGSAGKRAPTAEDADKAAKARNSKPKTDKS